MSKRKEFHVARTLRLRLSEKGDWLASVSRSSGEFFLAAELLPLLQEIQRCRSLDESIAQRLRRTLDAAARGSPDAREIQDLVDEFHGAGLLASEGAKARKDALLEDGFGDPWIQWAMLADTPRCRAYEAAVRRAVDAQSVVVDVGAGTGLLGAFALDSGAKKVFAIEETASGRGIAPLLKALGLPFSKPAFELFQGNSGDAPLPDEASVVVSELFGNDPFCEGVLPTLRDVGARLRVPGKRALGKQSSPPKAGKGAPADAPVRWIPQSLEVFVEVATLTGSAVKERVAALQRARLSLKQPDKARATGFLERFLLATAAHLPFDVVSFAAHLAPSDLVRQSTACSLGTVRLDPPSSPVVSYSGKRELKLEMPKPPPQDPRVALVWFRVRLDASNTLSNHPLEADVCSHWSPLVLPLAPFTESTLHVHFALSGEEDHLHVEISDTKGTPLARR
jgi:hypothetical protein